MEQICLFQKNHKYTGVLFINGERIEYFVKDGNSLQQLRRGTMGTGVKDNIILAMNCLIWVPTDCAISRRNL